MKKNLTLTFATIIITLILVESLSRIFLNPPQNTYISNRYMLYEENDTLENFDNFVKYHPNKEILSETYFDINDQFIKEYSYYIKTNNFGLVQENNLDQNKESILFLGDSFTEGQGVYAWINNFKGSYNNFQIINGGIMGTNPTQFYYLEKYLSKNLNIEKVLFIFLGHDFFRYTWKLKENTRKCLQYQKNCIGNEDFYGFNKENTKDINLYLNELKKYRVENASLLKKLKFYLKQLNIISIPLSYYKNQLSSKNNLNFESNLEKTNKLIDKYGKDIIFVRLNTKHEILAGKSYWTIISENEIKK